MKIETEEKMCYINFLKSKDTDNVGNILLFLLGKELFYEILEEKRGLK
jgi:hypothetical protein